MTTVTGMRYHQPSDLIALSCDDSSIRVIDIETKKLVRELFGCKGAVTDFVRCLHDIFETETNKCDRPFPMMADGSLLPLPTL